MRKESKSWIWDPQAECMSDDERAKVQSERLINCVNRMYEHVPYYRKRMEEKGIVPGISRVSRTCRSFLSPTNSISATIIRSEHWLSRETSLYVYMLLPEPPAA